MLGSALEVAFDRLGDSLAARLRDGAGGEPLNEQEAVARTRWIMVQRFGLKDEDLRLQAVEIEPPDKACIVLVAQDGCTCETDLRRQDGVVLVGRVKRTWPSQSDAG